MLKGKKREIICPHTDCLFYSSEHTQIDGDWIPITYCSHPNNALIENGKNCNFYQVNWAKQLQKVRLNNPADRVKMERQSILKLLQFGIGHLSLDEREAILGLVEQLKQQEERLGKLSEVLKDMEDINGSDPFVIPETASSPVETPAQEPEPIQEEPVEMTVAVPMKQEKPMEHAPEDCIKQFIESWNKQEFEKEYECLGGRLNAIPLQDYVRSRQYAYADAAKLSKNGSFPIQELGKIHSLNVEGDKARIICDKIEKYGRFPKTYQQKYMLERKNGNWKIIDMRTREL